MRFQAGEMAAVPAGVRETAHVLEAAGHRAYLVGGAVRDLLLGRAPHDFDLATDATPDRVLGLFARTVPTGLQHGTVTVLLGGDAVEVTTFRADGDYSDGRRPDGVHFVTDLRADLARRDFTVNAMAVRLADGVLEDPFGGEADLRDGVLRAVGNAADRFAEDGLRPMRAVRLAAQLSFVVEARTLAAVGGALDTFRRVSVERVSVEVEKMLLTPNAADGVRMLLNCGLLGDVLPEVAAGAGVTQNKYHAFDVFGHSLAALMAVQSDPMASLDVRLAALLHDVGKPVTRTVAGDDVHFYEHDDVGAEMVEARLRALRFPNVTVERVTRLVRFHLVRYEGKAWTDRTVRRFVRRVGEDVLTDLLLLYKADEAAKPKFPAKALACADRVERVMAERPALAARDLAVGGVDVMEVLGLAPGPEVGRVLRALMERVLDRPEENDRARLLTLAREV